MDGVKTLYVCATCGKQEKKYYPSIPKGWRIGYGSLNETIMFCSDKCKTFSSRKLYKMKEVIKIGRNGARYYVKAPIRTLHLKNTGEKL